MSNGKSRYGLLIDYEYCTGCHACVVACSQEHNWSDGMVGMKVMEVIEELPKDKDSLYQELIALEGKRYSLEKTFKQLERNYNDGSISEIEYKNRSDNLKNQQNEITSRINSIRRIIASM